MLQDTMLKVIDRIGDFRGDSPFWGWLRMIAVNEALMRVRRVRSHPDGLELDAQEHADDLQPPPPAAARRRTPGRRPVPPSPRSTTPLAVPSRSFRSS